MVQDLFTWLTHALEGSILIALLASLIWGILSILLSPCHLASIPLIVGYIDDQGNTSPKRAFYLAGLFSGGILITIAIVGLITSMAGRMLGDIGRTGNWIVAVIFFVMGFYLLGLIRMPFGNKADESRIKSRGHWGALLFGIAFGFAVGPCTFAYMAPMLGVAFRVASIHFLFAALLILSYAVGHCSVILLAGTFTGIVQKYVDWNKRSRGTLILRKICGILVILGGVYLILHLR